MTAYVLYQAARADFLERVRSYRFLLLLALMVAVAYLFIPTEGVRYITIDLDGYRGVYNSAWVGASVAMLVAGYLGPLGFVAVKGAVNRDRDTGVGQIIAASPVSKTTYILGKWLSNFAVLAAMTAVLLVAAGILQLVRGEERSLDVWALTAPFLIIVLPTMALIAALALLFEVTPILRSGVGIVVFFFLWLIIGFPLALAGSGILTNMKDGVQVVVPGHDVSSNCCLIFESNAMEVLGRELGPQMTFVWEGMSWSAANLLLHLALIAVALVLVFGAGRIFDRFASTQATAGRFTDLGQRGLDLVRRLGGDRRARSEVGEEVVGESVLSAALRLAPLDSRPTAFGLGRLLIAELRLALKGLQWWWYLVAAGLVVAGLVLPLDDGQRWILPVAWLWPILIWSDMGVREVTHRTNQIVFAASRPLSRQLPMAWSAGLFVALIAGSGVLVRMLIEADGEAILTWSAGALFIPSLALALGTWSSSAKLFQMTYLFLWYVGPMQQIQRFDFMGLDSQAAVDEGLP